MYFISPSTKKTERKTAFQDAEQLAILSEVPCLCFYDVVYWTHPNEFYLPLLKHNIHALYLRSAVKHSLSFAVCKYTFFLSEYKKNN